MKLLPKLGAICAAMALALGCETSSTFEEIVPEAVILGAAPGPQLDISKLTSKDRRVAAAAFLEMEKVIQDEEFLRRLNMRDWRAGCLDPIRVSGPDIIRDLQKNTAPVKLYKKKLRGSTTGNTDLPKRWIQITSSRFDNWNRSSPDKAEMVNTMLHELLHTVPYDSVTPPNRQWIYKYYDQDHGENGCTNADLVSYGVGNLAENVWLVRNPN